MTQEALKLALKALNAGKHAHLIMNTDGIKDKVRQAIAELESQEPYGWVSQHTTKGMYEWQFNKEIAGVYQDTAISILPVYTHPPQRTWVGLTDEEVKDIVWNLPYEPSQEHIRAIEAKLKDKNSA
jgi:hypothetical protein